MSKEKQIEEMAKVMCGYYGTEKCYDCCYCCDCHIKQEANRLYEQNYRKLSEGEWISVEERWPETDGYYLVWNKEQRKIEIRFFHRLPPHYPVETYPEIRAYFGNCADHKSITHWMPLPEPPKGDHHE